jgi:flagella basal body P-ring formation protein FlgA
MVLASPGLTLSATGRAIEAGGEGEVIQVMNVQSRKTVPATIVGHNQVQVSSRTTVITGAGR